ncbi:protein kinase domain-containing protein [Streptomyces lasiicapitis]|uniref:protein kinase domain-containing protein n=1 Tax=Streptomyces lasiicapitis TaxID=1923961 RepID=UPI0036C89435
MSASVEEAARLYLRDREIRSLRGTEHYNHLLTAISDALIARGVDQTWIRSGREAVLPGSYELGRTTWDIVIFSDDVALAAVTLKQASGPSYGNNFYNRIQELTGNAFAVRQHDVQTIEQFRPYLGIFFIIEESKQVNAPLRIPTESGAKPRSGPSYKERYGNTFAQFCTDGLYDGIAYVAVSKGSDPSFEEPRPDMSVKEFIDSLATRVLSYAAARAAKAAASVAASPTALPEMALPTLGPYREVIRDARGDRAAYALDRVPMGEGTQGQVFRAIHKASQTEVAFKRRRSKRDRAVARMRREIEISRLLSAHPNAMPILDAESDSGWFVMPMADATAEDHRDQLQDPDRLSSLVTSIASVLREAHKHDWVHRDIKPSNILLLQGTWVLADWGIGRRPRGQTTLPGRTGHYIGTEGFAAPELSSGPHNTTSHASDIYSLGRVIAWALTGKSPQVNVPLLPNAGPWRSIVRAATQPDPADRPQSVDELLALIAREFSVPQRPPVEQAEPLLIAAHAGDPTSVNALLVLITDFSDDYNLYVEVLVELPPERAAPPLSRNPQQANALLHAFAQQVDGDGVKLVQFRDAARVVAWLHALAAWAADQSEWDLLDEAVRTMCTWDAAWDQWDPQDTIRPWLRSLTGDAASIVASAFRDHPGSAGHFEGLADEQGVDMGIQQAVRVAPARQR